MLRLQVDKVATLTGHNDSIYTLEHSGEAPVFFSGAGDGMVAQWDLRNPEQGQLVVSLPSSVYALRYVSEYNQLLVGQNFQGLHLIDLESRKEVVSANVTQSAIFDIKTFEGKVYAGTGDGNIIVTDQQDLSVIVKLKASNQSVRSLAINDRDRVMAAGFSDNAIRIIDLDKHEVLKTIKGHYNSVFSVVYTADYKYLLSAGRDAHVRIWDVENDYHEYTSFAAHMYAINHIELSPYGNTFATCSLDKSIKVWDSEKFKLLKVIDKSRYAGHGTSVNKLLWPGYSNQIVACSDDRTISVWSIVAKELAS